MNYREYIQCKNCNKQVSDNYGFCPFCGQKMGLGRLNFRQLLKDLWVAFSNTDRGILLLIKQLTYKPGHVARDYISGRRKTYFNPFSYLAIMVALALFFVLRFEDMGLVYTSAEAEDIELLQFAFKYFNIIIFLMCPIYGLVIWMFFLGRQINYIENLVLAAYLSGQTMLYYILAITLFLIFPSSLKVLGIIFGFLISIWYIIAVLQFYRTRSAWSIFKSLLVIIIAQFISQWLMIASYSIYQ